MHIGFGHMHWIDMKSEKCDAIAHDLDQDMRYQYHIVRRPGRVAIGRSA